MLETSNDNIDFRFLVASQLFRFERFGCLYVKLNDAWALQVNEGSQKRSGLFSDGVGFRVYPVRLTEIES